MGLASKAYNWGSTAMGQYSTAIGYQTEADGYNTTAIGSLNTIDAQVRVIGVIQIELLLLARMGFWG